MSRPKLNREKLSVRVNKATPQKLQQIAIELGYQWGDKGNTGALLDDLSKIPAEHFKDLFEMSRNSHL